MAYGGCFQLRTEGAGSSLQRPIFSQKTFAPMWYCLVATGDRDFGHVPPCDSPIKIGDVTKCKKSDED